MDSKTRKFLSWGVVVVGIYFLWPLLASAFVRSYLDFNSVFWSHSSILLSVCLGLLISLTIVAAHAYRIIASPHLRVSWKLAVLGWVFLFPALACSSSQITHFIHVNNWEQDAAPISSLGGMVSKKHGEWRVECVDKNVDDNVFKQWFPALARLEVENLGLAHSRVSEKSVARLPQLESLKNLDLTGTMVTDDSLEKLSEMKNIEVLVLTGTPVTDEGMVFLARLQNLRRLHLDSTNVTNKGLNSLMEISTLKFLSIKDTKVDDEGTSLLLESMPDLSLVNP